VRRFVGIVASLLASGCVTPAQIAPHLRPECFVLSICSVASAQIAAFNPELTDPQAVTTKGPGHALAAFAPQLVTKQGEACAHLILGVFAWGDASIRAAVLDAGVERISTVDYERLSVLAFVYQEFCTRVSGVSTARE
jgi:hypothetical protein